MVEILPRIPSSSNFFNVLCNCSNISYYYCYHCRFYTLYLFQLSCLVLVFPSFSFSFVFPMWAVGSSVADKFSSWKQKVRSLGFLYSLGVFISDFTLESVWQISRTLLCILTDLNGAKVWIVSILPLISYSTSLFSSSKDSLLSYSTTL